MQHYYNAMSIFIFFDNSVQLLDDGRRGRRRRCTLVFVWREYLRARAVKIK